MVPFDSGALPVTPAIRAEEMPRVIALAVRQHAGCVLADDVAVLALALA